MLLHGLQQGRLGLGCGAVNLIGQHQIGENGARLESETASALLLHHDISSRHIAGHQIRCELDSLERKAEHLADGAYQHGLAQSRHTLQKHIPPGEHHQHYLSDNVSLTDDPLADLLLTLHDFSLIQL